MKKKSTYLKQKLHLYFDENFPQEVIDTLKSSSYWKKKCRIYSVYSEGLIGKNDLSQFEYCKQNNWTLVTLDKHFMDDSKYPISNIPGIIRVVAKKQDSSNILAVLENLLDFFTGFPIPRTFLGDTKLEVNNTFCFVRAKDAKTRKIKTMKIKPGDSSNDVRDVFSFW